MIKSITNVLIILFIFQQFKSQISQIDQNGYNAFCDETLHILLYVVIFAVDLFSRIVTVTPCEKFNFNLCLFIVMKVSEKSRNETLANFLTQSKTAKIYVRENYGVYNYTVYTLLSSIY